MSDQPPLKKSEMREGMSVRAHPDYTPGSWIYLCTRLVITKIETNGITLMDPLSGSLDVFRVDDDGYGLHSKRPLLIALQDKSCRTDTNSCPECGMEGEFIALAMKCPKCWKVW